MKRALSRLHTRVSPYEHKCPSMLTRLLNAPRLGLQACNLWRQKCRQHEQLYTPGQAAHHLDLECLEDAVMLS